MLILVRSVWHVLIGGFWCVLDISNPRLLCRSYFATNIVRSSTTSNFHDSKIFYCDGYSFLVSPIFLWVATLLRPFSKLHDPLPWSIQPSLGCSRILHNPSQCCVTLWINRPSPSVLSTVATDHLSLSSIACEDHIYSGSPSWSLTPWFENSKLRNPFCCALEASAMCTSLLLVRDGFLAHFYVDFGCIYRAYVVS